MLNYFLNRLRPNPARPTKPEPSSISVAGSGTGLVSVSIGSETSEVATGVKVVELKLDVVAGSSDEGQPTIPKNIITIHKNINNFFIFFLFLLSLSKALKPFKRLCAKVGPQQLDADYSTIKLITYIIFIKRFNLNIMKIFTYFLCNMGDIATDIIAEFCRRD